MPIIFLGISVTSHPRFMSYSYSYSYCTVTHFIFALYSNTPPHPSLTITITIAFHHCQPTSSCAHIVLDIRICSMLLKVDGHFRMSILTGIVKRGPSPLHAPQHNKHNINMAQKAAHIFKKHPSPQTHKTWELYHCHNHLISYHQQ
jgi:hypothetical protein